MSHSSRTSCAWGLRCVVVVSLVALCASPAGADLYSILKPLEKYGTLDQDDIPNGGQFMCGPTAAVNSFVYLQNAYPAIYDNSLVPVGAAGGVDLDNSGTVDSYDDLIAVAQTVSGANYMNTKPVLQGGGGGAGTWDDMFIYGKMNYIETVLPGQTVYAAQLLSQWGWLGAPPRPIDERPPIAKPAWVQQQTMPTWQFLYNELADCEDVEILITDDTWGHFLTVTGFVWNDVNNNTIVDGAENAVIHYIDPATGAAGISAIAQAMLGGQLFVAYGAFNAQLVMTVSESPIPEPASLALLGAGVITLLRRRR